METTIAASDWIGSLVGADHFFSPRGFEASVVVYHAMLRGSFLASVINGVRETASFAAPESRYRYSELVRQICNLSGGERAFWCYLTAPDNCFTVINWVRECDYDSALDGSLCSFETEPAAQGGVARLALFGSSRRWLLVHEYQAEEEFDITFHGPAAMCQKLCRQLRCSANA